METYFLPTISSLPVNERPFNGAINSLGSSLTSQRAEDVWSAQLTKVSDAVVLAQAAGESENAEKITIPLVEVLTAPQALEDGLIYWADNFEVVQDSILLSGKWKVSGDDILEMEEGVSFPVFKPLASDKVEVFSLKISGKQASTLKFTGDFPNLFVQISGVEPGGASHRGLNFYSLTSSTFQDRTGRIVESSIENFLVLQYGTEGSRSTADGRELIEQLQRLDTHFYFVRGQSDFEVKQITVDPGEVVSSLVRGRLPPTLPENALLLLIGNADIQQRLFRMRSDEVAAYIELLADHLPMDTTVDQVRLLMAHTNDTEKQRALRGALGDVLRALGVGEQRVNLQDMLTPGIDLGAAQLQFANFSGLQAHGAVLDSANLNGGDLTRADLRGARFNGASLQFAHLRGANMRNADLTRANLYQADLLAANFSGANLSDASFRDANVHNAIFAGADLRGANFERARGLTAEQLLHADVRDAVLPQGMHERITTLRAQLGIDPPEEEGGSAAMARVPRGPAPPDGGEALSPGQVAPRPEGERARQADQSPDITGASDVLNSENFDAGLDGAAKFVTLPRRDDNDSGSPPGGGPSAATLQTTWNDLNESAKARQSREEGVRQRAGVPSLPAAAPQNSAHHHNLVKDINAEQEKAMQQINAPDAKQRRADLKAQLDAAAKAQFVLKGLANIGGWALNGIGSALNLLYRMSQ